MSPGQATCPGAEAPVVLAPALDPVLEPVLAPGLLQVLAAVLAVAAVALLVPPRTLPSPALGSRLPPARGGSRGLPVRAWPVLAGIGAASAVALVVGGTVGAAVALPAGGAVGWWVSRLEAPRERRRRQRLEVELPHAVDLLAACLRAGHSPGTAVRLVADALDPGPLQDELHAVATRLHLGADPIQAWRELARDHALAPLGRAVVRALDGGGSVADALGRLAEDRRSARRGEVEARARSVGVRAAVPLGVCMLPAFVLVGVVPLVAGSLGALFAR